MTAALPTSPLTEFLLLSSEELGGVSRSRGLSLNAEEMAAIQHYFREQKRNPTEAELETLAQTWSEHCKHKFGKTFLLRNALLGTNLVLACALLTTMAVHNGAGTIVLSGWAVVAVAALATSLIGRALFYVLVIPTTMPGAFFWKNKGFEDHARAIGLATMPQVGVAMLRH